MIYGASDNNFQAHNDGLTAEDNGTIESIGFLYH